ncbi:hypothetical protein RvY_10933 [Ramazzottius varieornatus]|uniref:Uncharacterized protein n=1 Tax=Ramazzottius varieornatus TaxID=947166 RepID=A0A1D1VND0_RAMVA|nr:hypothetical protein RvY_10933 [Ramazzottius varieornatus]
MRSLPAWMFAKPADYAGKCFQVPEKIARADRNLDFLKFVLQCFFRVELEQLLLLESGSIRHMLFSNGKLQLVRTHQTLPQPEELLASDQHRHFLQPVQLRIFLHLLREDSSTHYLAFTQLHSWFFSR